MFHDMEQFNKFLKEAFTKIRGQNVSSLIVDIRKNPGGSSSLGDELLRYLTDKPFRQFEKVEIKVSRQILEAQSHIRKVYPDAAIGSTVTREGEFRKPEDNPLRFKGRVYVLIGPNSASSSVCFASAVKHFHIGKLVGQETIDTTVNYGDCIRNELPNCGLYFSVACKYFVEAGGKPDGRGVLPDYKVKQKPEDTARGVDTTLQFTLDLIKEGT
jgi:C-terminal processing protease CtpA/Prc